MINDQRNKWVRCSSGIKFRPTPFLLYFNDLPNCLEHSNPNLFADNTNVSTSAESREELKKWLNSDVQNIYRKLTLNLTKTEYMTIGSPHNVNKIDLNPEIEIARLSVMGMVIDIKIAWEGYNDHVSKKVSRGIGTIKLIKPHVPKNCLNRIYNAVLTPLVH